MGLAAEGELAVDDRAAQGALGVVVGRLHTWVLADPKLAGFEGVVEDSGEGRWTVMAAIEEAVPADVLSAALYARFRSRREHTFAEKILSAMRKGFGDHVEPTDRKAEPS